MFKSKTNKDGLQLKTKKDIPAIGTYNLDYYNIENNLLKTKNKYINIEKKPFNTGEERFKNNKDDNNDMNNISKEDIREPKTKKISTIKVPMIYEALLQWFQVLHPFCTER